MDKRHLLKGFSLLAVFAITGCGGKSTTFTPDPDVEISYVDPSQIKKEAGCFHTLDQLGYINSSYNTAQMFAEGTEEMSNPTGNDILFAEEDGLLLQVSRFADFHEDPDTPYLDTRLFDIKDHKKATIKNLLSDTTYYWRTFNIKDTDSTPSETGSFKTCSHLPRFIDIEDISTSKYVTNVRDMGGYESTLPGYSKVKQGLIYRSGRMSGSTNAPREENEPFKKPVSDTGKPSYLMNDAGYNTLIKTLGMKGEIDLRSNVCKDNNDGGAYYVENGNRAKYTDVIPGITCIDPGIVAERAALLQDLDAQGLDSGWAQVKQVFEFYAKPEFYPNFIHCYIGTDRTGCMCYLLECLLGMKDEDMYRDYLWSNFGLINGSRNLDAIKTYERVLKGYGKETMAENCVALLKSDKVGISDEQIKIIRDTLLEKAQ